MTDSRLLKDQSTDTWREKFYSCGCRSDKRRDARDDLVREKVREDRSRFKCQMMHTSSPTVIYISTYKHTVVAVSYTWSGLALGCEAKLCLKNTAEIYVERKSAGE